MADHIPFVNSEEGCTLTKQLFHDSQIVRVPLDRASRFLPLLHRSAKFWIDPCVDGMDNIEMRRNNARDNNTWLGLMSKLANFDKIGDPTFWSSPVKSDLNAFVKAVMHQCMAHGPAWITVPQLPLVSGSARNKMNRLLAEATGRWKSTSTFSGRLILPLVFTHQDLLNRKTKRNPKVQQAERCYHEAQADGFWLVDGSLKDESGSKTLRNVRFPGILSVHEELNERISSKIKIAGPYWGLNLVLWAKGLVEYPAIGVGSGYQYSLAGGPAKSAKVRLALPSLRRRAEVVQLKPWLDHAISKLGQTHPAAAELNELKKNLTILTQHQHARTQVASFYKRWFDVIASAPKAGRSMALFQDLTTAYAFGKLLPDLVDENTARRPEAVAEPLMLSCL